MLDTLILFKSIDILLSIIIGYFLFSMLSGVYKFFTQKNLNDTEEFMLVALLVFIMLIVIPSITIGGIYIILKLLGI